MEQNNSQLNHREMQVLIVIETESLRYLDEIKELIWNKTKRLKDRVFFIYHGVAVLAPCFGYSGPVEPEIVINQIISRLDKELEHFFGDHAIEGKPYKIYSFKLSDEYIKANKFLEMLHN